MNTYQLAMVNISAQTLETLKRIPGLFTNREKAIQEFIEDESQIYFERLEEIEDKYVKEFCSQAICSVIGNAYDFFYYIHSDHNIFYKNIKSLNVDMGGKFYKWNSLYHTITYATTHEQNGDDICYGMADVFKWNRKDKMLFKYYADMRFQCDAQFEVEFVRDMTKNIFGAEVINPVVLAQTGNLFYNSYKEFLCELGVYV